MLADEWDQFQRRKKAWPSLLLLFFHTLIHVYNTVQYGTVHTAVNVAWYGEDWGLGRGSTNASSSLIKKILTKTLQQQSCHPNISFSSNVVYFLGPLGLTLCYNVVLG
jgi:hypothetical protein